MSGGNGNWRGEITHSCMTLGRQLTSALSLQQRPEQWTFTIQVTLSVKGQSRRTSPPKGLQLCKSQLLTLLSLDALHVLLGIC